MVGVAVAAVGVGSSLIGGSSAKKAANTQADAAKEAAQAQLEAARLSANTALGIYGSTKASLQPFTNVGTSALNQLAMMYGLPVSNPPTGASQVPVIPGLNDQQTLNGQANGGQGQFQGTANFGPFGTYPVYGGNGGGNGGGGDPHAGMTATQPTAAQQVNWLLTNSYDKPGSSSWVNVHNYAAQHANETPEQQLAGLTQILGNHPKLASQFQSWMQGATTYAQNPATGGNDPNVPPANGQPAAPNFTAMLAALEQTPGYQFGRQQGIQALDRSAASRGLTLSGAQLQDTQKFGTDYAQAAAWNPYVTQLNTLASLGQNSAAGTGNAGTAAAGQVGSALAAGATGAGNANMMGAQATANGQIAQGKMWQDILGGIGSLF